MSWWNSDFVSPKSTGKISLRRINLFCQADISFAVEPSLSRCIPDIALGNIMPDKTDTVSFNDILNKDFSGIGMSTPLASKTKGNGLLGDTAMIPLKGRNGTEQIDEKVLVECFWDKKESEEGECGNGVENEVKRDTLRSVVPGNCDNVSVRHFVTYNARLLPMMNSSQTIREEPAETRDDVLNNSCKMVKTLPSNRAVGCQREEENVQQRRHIYSKIMAPVKSGYDGTDCICLTTMDHNPKDNGQMLKEKCPQFTGPNVEGDLADAATNVKTELPSSYADKDYNCPFELPTSTRPVLLTFVTNAASENIKYHKVKDADLKLCSKNSLKCNEFFKGDREGNFLKTERKLHSRLLDVSKHRLKLDRYTENPRQAEEKENEFECTENLKVKRVTNSIELTSSRTKGDNYRGTKPLEKNEIMEAHSLAQSNISFAKMETVNQDCLNEKSGAGHQSGRSKGNKVGKVYCTRARAKALTESIEKSLMKGNLKCDVPDFKPVPKEPINSSKRKIYNTRALNRKQKMEAEMKVHSTAIGQKSPENDYHEGHNVCGTRAREHSGMSSHSTKPPVSEMTFETFIALRTKHESNDVSSITSNFDKKLRERTHYSATVSGVPTSADNGEKMKSANFVSSRAAAMICSKNTHSSAEKDQTMGRVLRERKPKSSNFKAVLPGYGYKNVKKVGESKLVGQVKSVHVKKTQGGNGTMDRKRQVCAKAIPEVRNEMSSNLALKKEKKVKQQENNPGKIVSQKSSTGPSDFENKCTEEKNPSKKHEETLISVSELCSVAGEKNVSDYPHYSSQHLSLTVLGADTILNCDSGIPNQIQANQKRCEQAMCPDIILNKTVTKLPESGSEISHISLSQMSRKIPIETQASRQKTDCARTKAVFLKPAKMRLTDFVHSKRAVQSDSIKTDVPVQKTSSQRTDLVKTKPIALALKQDGKRNAVAVSSRKAEESNQIRIEGLRPERSRIKTDPVKSKSKLTVPKKIEKKKTVLLCSKAALPRSPNSATTSTSCCRTDSSVNFVSSDKCGISEVLNENKRQSGSHANFVSCPSATVTGSQRTHSSTEEDKTMGRILRERKPKSSSLGVVHPGNGHAIVKKVGKSKPVGQTKLVKKTEGGNGLLEMKHQEYAELEAITEMKKEVSRPTDLTVKKEKKVKQQKSNPGKGVSQKSSTHTGPSDCENKCSGEIQSLEGNEETLMFVGAHCSIAGGVSNAVKEAKSLGAKAFGLFVRNGRTWKLNALNESESERFKAACKEHGYSPHLILPHGSYLLNCGSSNPDTLKKSRDTLVHELQICEKLGLTLYNFHPGSACGQGTVDQCIDTIGKSINLAHSKTKFVKTVIENMSCQGQTVGGRFEELKAIIDRVKDKTRVGVCLDTCHAFAAGFDLSSEEGYTKMMNDFEEKIGLKYLSAAHLNDSKGELGCHLDRHENIGKGRIGMDGFRRVMNDPRFRNIPMILETPVGDYAKEIQTLYQLTK